MNTYTEICPAKDCERYDAIDDRGLAVAWFGLGENGRAAKPRRFAGEIKMTVIGKRASVRAILKMSASVSVLSLAVAAVPSYAQDAADEGNVLITAES